MNQNRLRDLAMSRRRPAVRSAELLMKRIRRDSAAAAKARRAKPGAARRMQSRIQGLRAGRLRRPGG
jgi:hypothetical protein